MLLLPVTFLKYISYCVSSCKKKKKERKKKLFRCFLFAFKIVFKFLNVASKAVFFEIGV